MDINASASIRLLLYHEKEVAVISFDKEEGVCTLSFDSCDSLEDIAITDSQRISLAKQFREMAEFLEKS